MDSKRTSSSVHFYKCLEAQFRFIDIVECFKFTCKVSKINDPNGVFSDSSTPGQQRETVGEVASIQPPGFGIIILKDA